MNQQETRMRVCMQQRGLYRVMDEAGEILTARVNGKWMHEAKDALDFPVVGDYVWIRRDTGVMMRLEARQNVLTRIGADPSGRVRQPIAANLDALWCCMALGQDVRVSRVERYLAAAAGAGIPAVVLLTKADLCADVSAAVRTVQHALPGVECMPISMADAAGIQALQRRIAQGQSTVALAGASGVGKSTLCNALLGEEYLRTAAVREGDMRGRHTTTQRELILLPTGGVLIDTPGMRAFALDESDVGGAFEALGVLRTKCRFRDCTHTCEPGCALRAAVERGEVDEKTLQSYVRLMREQARRARKRK